LLLLVAAAPEDSAVVRVGGIELDAVELRERVEALPPARLLELPGGSAGTRAYVEDVLVPELLLEHHSRQVKLPTAQRDRALAYALEARLARSLEIPESDIVRFHAEHRATFHSPPAVVIWRIVTDSEQEAREILDGVRGQATGAEIWSSLARERSLDAATKMRRGDLGFVQPDGRTDVPQVRVNAAVFEAASKLADGELSSEPLRDGPHYSAIWRRGSRPAQDTKLANARDEIRRILVRQRSSQALGQLVARLRQASVTAYAPEGIESVDYAEPETTRRRRPLVTRPATAPPAPTRTVDGER
jgi:hypothetical protein